MYSRKTIVKSVLLENIYITIFVKPNALIRLLIKIMMKFVNNAIQIVIHVMDNEIIVYLVKTTFSILK